MNRLKIVILAILISNACFAKANNKSTNIKDVSYSAGYMLGKNAKNSADDLNLDEMVKGFKDGYNNQTPRLSDNKMEASITNYLAQQNTEKNKVLLKNRQIEQAFLAQNAKKSGVISTKSGLQYQILRQGNGKKPKATDTVKVSYTGKLLDGTIFDSTDGHGETSTTFPLNYVILGWTEGLQLMPTGSKYRFFIPAELAYGETGIAGKIEPNSLLIFDVELLAIEKSN